MVAKDTKGKSIVHACLVSDRSAKVSGKVCLLEDEEIQIACFIKKL